ncbi:MAG TPA: SPFH domain-containing protein, partial [Gemmatales bacterium]|nr:SPFH domain-containing protein [Gemmatales bacterium]
WAGFSAVLFVDQAEYVVVTRFGRLVEVIDGRTAAGPHFKLPWPVDSAWRLDRRLDLLDVPTQELLIRDRDEGPGADKPLPLTFDLFVCWRIGDPQGDDAAAVDRFIRSFGHPDKARQFLRSQLISRLKIELSEVLITDLINTDATKLRWRTILQRIRSQPFATDPGEPPLSLEQRAAQVGIALVDVGLRRFNHPQQVRDEIFAKIREERRREANTYQLQGEEQAARIRAEGELEARRIRSEAEAERIRIEGQAEADAVRLLNDAHAQAPELYRIVRLLKGYRQMFADDKTQLILSLDHPLLQLFKNVPGMGPASGVEGDSGASRNTPPPPTAGPERKPEPRR